MTRRVVVAKLPDRVTGQGARAFCAEVEASMEADRPYLVLDCSGVTLLDERATLMLVCCLESAMKRNGDVRLASVSPESKAVLVRTGIHRLFEQFASVEDAVSSFERRPLDSMIPEMASLGSAELAAEPRA